MNDNGIFIPKKPELVTPQGNTIPEKISKEIELKRQARLNDITKMQLMTARIQKAAGRNVDQRVYLGALATAAAQAMAHSPIRKHHGLMSAFMQGLTIGLMQTYTKEQRALLEAIVEAQAKGEDHTNLGLAIDETQWDKLSPEEKAAITAAKEKARNAEAGNDPVNGGDVRSGPQEDESGVRGEVQQSAAQGERVGLPVQEELGERSQTAGQGDAEPPA